MRGFGFEEQVELVRKLTVFVLCLSLLLPLVLQLIWSFTDSGISPSYHFIGLQQYTRLFSNHRWLMDLRNVAICAGGMILICLPIAYVLAFFICLEGRHALMYLVLYLLPLSVSFVAVGVIWRWILDPVDGIVTGFVHLWSPDFSFQWLVRRDRSALAVLLVSAWQQLGLATSLFVAGMRRIDRNIWKIAKVEGIGTFQIGFFLLPPMLVRSGLLIATLLLVTVVKSYEVVLILTGGGPGQSSDLPSLFVLDLLDRGDLGLAAAATGTVLVFVGGCAVLFWRYARSVTR